MSILLDDVSRGVEVVCNAIGIPEPRPQSYRSGPGADAVFCRVHTKYAVAPTFLELIAPPATTSFQTTTADPFGLNKTAARQGTRPIKWHATELAMPEQEMLALADYMREREIPVGFVPHDRRDRFFVGGDPASADYDASYDGGLLIEVGRSGHLGLPEDVFTAPADVPADVNPGTMIRIVAREYLVGDLDGTLALLEQNLRWRPASVNKERHCRRAIMPFGVPRSARLELVQPHQTGPVADAYAALGPGAWTIRVSVVDLEAKADDLVERGTSFVRDGTSLRTDPLSTLNLPFEFVPASP